MIIDRPSPKDIEVVKELYEKFQKDKHFVMPTAQSVIDHCIVRHEGNVVGYGLLKQTPEGLIILDQAQPKRVMVEALRELIQASVMATSGLGLDELLVFTDDERYAGLLRKHFGFRNGQPALFLDL